MSSILDLFEKENINLHQFTEEEQDAVIGHAIEDRSFFISCMAHLEASMFTSVLNGAVFQVIQDLYKSMKMHPTKQEIKSKIQSKHHDAPAKYVDRMNACIAMAGNVRLEYLAPRMTGWMYIVKFGSALQEAVRYYNSKQFEQGALFYERKMSEAKRTTFEGDKKITFNDPDRFFSQRNESFEDCLTIGHPIFDKLLREGAAKKDADLTKPPPKFWTNGGLVKGDTTVILGPSNSGKTTTVTSIIVPNILNEKHVLYFTHEQKWEDIKTKLFMCMCNATADELRKPDNALQGKMEFAGKMLDKYLTYIPWVKAGDMWVESVIQEIELQQEYLQAAYGKGYDLMVNDYPGKLKSKEMKGRQTWEETDYVYDQFVNAAMQHRFHALLPVQTNREGYKVNRGDHSSGRVIDQADAAGSFGIMQKADNVITLNRSPEEQAMGIMRFFISKSRTNEAQTTFATKTDFARSRTHNPRLKAMEFNANEDSSPRVIMPRLIGQEAVDAELGKKSISDTIEAALPKPVEKPAERSNFIGESTPGVNYLDGIEEPAGEEELELSE